MTLYSFYFFVFHFFFLLFGFLLINFDICTYFITRIFIKTPTIYTFRLSTIFLVVRTSENTQYNGHVDNQNTKEEEVYHDLCAIQRASRSQVFFVFSFFII